MQSYAQVLQTARFEKENKYNDEEFSIVPLKEDGLGLIRPTNKYKSGKRTWELFLLDTALNDQGIVEFEIDSRNNLIGYEYAQGFAHILFLKNETTGEMLLLSVHLANKETVQHEIKSELNFKLTHFHKVGDNFIFGGFVNMEPCVLHFNPQSESLKIIPGFFQKDTELIDLRVNTNETFNALILDRGDRDDRKIIFRTFDPTGMLLLEDITSVDNDITIQNGISTTLEREDLLVLGMWGKKKSKHALGFYALPINPFADDPVKPVYFGELEHYLDYLKPKRAAALKLKTKRALENKRTPEYTSLITPYKIVEHNTGFILLAESYSSPSNASQPNYGYGYSPYNNYPYNYPYGTYYPAYRRYTPTAYGSNVITTEELKKVHSVLVSFTNTGSVAWDLSVKFTDVKTETLMQVSEFSITPDSAFLMYKKASGLQIKSINLETQESHESSQKIKLSDVYDEIRNEQKQPGGITHWFNNTFYVWGYQTIRNKTKPDKTRDVFYINKIIVR
jgi:hypothetical protein